MPFEQWPEGLSDLKEGDLLGYFPSLNCNIVYMGIVVSLEKNHDESPGDVDGKPLDSLKLIVVWENDRVNTSFTIYGHTAHFFKRLAEA